MAADQVVGAEMLLQGGGEALQYEVARGMAMRVVHALEEVDVPMIATLGP